MEIQAPVPYRSYYTSASFIKYFNIFFFFFFNFHVEFDNDNNNNSTRCEWNIHDIISMSWEYKTSRRWILEYEQQVII